MSVSDKPSKLPPNVPVIFNGELWLTNECEEPYFGIYLYWLHPVNRRCDRVRVSMYELQPANPAAEVLFGSS